MVGLSWCGSRFAVAAALLALLLVAACDAQPPPAVTATPLASSTPGEEVSIPDATTPTPVPSPTGIDETGRADIYVSIVLDMLDKEGKEVGYVYVSPFIGQGEHLDNPDPSTPIPGSLVLVLRAAPGPSSRTYEALDFSEVVGPFEDGGKVANGGVFITLGPIMNTEGKEDAVTVKASIYRESKSAEGNIYNLSRDPASATGWKVVTVSPEWSSAR